MGITILGGGPAGLAAGFYARRHGIPFLILEAAGHAGGNCTTLQHGEFRFDSGAHRFHDKDPEVTADVKTLLGAELQRVDASSHIYHAGRLIDFPLSPGNLMSRLGARRSFRAAVDLVTARLLRHVDDGSFEAFAIRTYGATIAGAFLLGYSEKLWGLPCRQLSPNISGARMKGLTIATFLTEAVLGHGAKTAHLDGGFYYPRLGIGRIMERLAEACGDTTIRRNARVTRIFHHDGRIHAVEVNGSELLEVHEVVATLPLGLIIALLHPPPPEPIRRLASTLKFRHVALVALFLNRSRVTRSATVYFPDPQFAFTRVCEPRNRSALMAPEGHTSLVAEIPYSDSEPVAHMDDEALVQHVRHQFITIGWIADHEVIGAATRRVRFAYPILELGFEQRVRELLQYLERFRNLRLSGRSGRFAYTHVHDMLRLGRDLIEEYRARPSPSRGARGARLVPDSGH